MVAVRVGVLSHQEPIFQQTCMVVVFFSNSLFILTLCDVVEIIAVNDYLRVSSCEKMMKLTIKYMYKK